MTAFIRRSYLLSSGLAVHMSRVILNEHLHPFDRNPFLSTKRVKKIKIANYMGEYSSICGGMILDDFFSFHEELQQSSF